MTLSIIATLTASLVLAGEYVLHHAEPILRKRIIETLSARFNAPVELDRIHISLVRGMEVRGSGLRIPFRAADEAAPAYPLVTVEHFAFRTSFRALWRQPMRVAVVQVDGMELHIPPSQQRQQVLKAAKGRNAADPRDALIRPKIAIVVQELQCRDVKLFLQSGKAEKDPLFFNIHSLRIEDLGGDKAMLYDAQLTNPKPRGLIHAKGHFGPWGGVALERRSEAPDPDQTPIDGEYTFDGADLNTIRGIGGTLSSTGRFAGVLGRITVDGKTEVPDFSLDISNHAVPLRTEFHAIVDGTSGDTFLQPVHAYLGTSEFTTSGKVVKIKGKGHDIQLDVEIPRGHMQDFLRLAVKTTPPLMNGLLHMKASLHIPPGPERVPLKVEMKGDFSIAGVQFNNARWQDQVDGLSARAQGRPRDVAEVSHDREAEVHSELASRFTINHGLVTAQDVRYAVPGAVVLLNGVYSMDGKLFEFKGRVRTEATASQMVTGWKSWLLKPADRFLKKNGAGLEIPIEISGTEGEMHFGLALRGTDQTPEEMLAEVQEKNRKKHRKAESRRLANLADEEDQRAAKASTLEAAEAAHKSAVRHRAEAMREALESEEDSPSSKHP